MDAFGATVLLWVSPFCGCLDVVGVLLLVRLLIFLTVLQGECLLLAVSL